MASYSVRTVHTVDSHSEGNPTRVIVGGVPVPPGVILNQEREWIHDPQYYFSHQLHTSIDVTSLVNIESVRRNAAIIASVVYHTAMRDEMLPRGQIC